MLRKKVSVKNFRIGCGEPLTIISGPCVIEGEDKLLFAAQALKKMLGKFKVNFIFKSSYDKANRSSIDSYRGPGLYEGLRLLEKVKDLFDLPVVTDVHSAEEARAAGEICDIVQVPAFLVRQTDLVVAAGKTGKVVQLKKGQFMAPWDMKNAVDKVLSTGNENILLIDRGTTFGYNNLISDMRAIPIMQNIGFPVGFDATHSVQLPGGLGTMTGGQREFIPVLARSALAAGADYIFAESHLNPQEGLSDSQSMLSFEELEKNLPSWIAIHDILRGIAQGE